MGFLICPLGTAEDRRGGDEELSVTHDSTASEKLVMKR